MAPFGLFGPVTFQTRRGTRITFFAGLLTIPLTAYSVYHLYNSLPRDEKRERTGSGHASSADPTTIDLSDR